MDETKWSFCFKNQSTKLINWALSIQPNFVSECDHRVNVVNRNHMYYVSSNTSACVVIIVKNRREWWGKEEKKKLETTWTKYINKHNNKHSKYEQNMNFQRMSLCWVTSKQYNKMNEKVCIQATLNINVQNGAIRYIIWNEAKYLIYRNWSKFRHPKKHDFDPFSRSLTNWKKGRTTQIKL